jgi:hypothetical protein
MDLRFLSGIMVLLLLAGQAVALDLEISVEEEVQGHAAWFSLSNGPAQIFNVRWENIGSVNCLSRPRIDFMRVMGNGTLGDLAYTAWGPEDRVLTGASREWQLYSSLPEGDYAAVLRVYHCNEIFEHEPYLFSAPGSEPGDEVSINGIEVHKDYLDVLVSGNAEVVVPEDYPSGWIFQGGEVRDGRARLHFVPVSLAGVSVILRAVSAGGDAAVREFSMTVPEQEEQIPWGVIILLLVILVFLLYVTRNIINIWRR